MAAAACHCLSLLEMHRLWNKRLVLLLNAASEMDRSDASDAHINLHVSPDGKNYISHGSTMNIFPNQIWEQVLYTEVLRSRETAIIFFLD